MNPSELADLQASEARQQIALEAVGISGLRHPVVVLDRLCAKQETVASLTMAVDLAASQRGAHLSRFLDVLSDAESELTVRTAQSLLAAIASRLGATTATIDAEFPYFIEKHAPVTGARGLLDVACRFSFRGGVDSMDFVLMVAVPVTTLCPCSRAVSDYGAHNQRCAVTIAVRAAVTEEPADDEIVWIEDLVDLAERHASAPIYPALKRADERFVTMQAYDNPAFVEDVVRGIAEELAGDHRVAEFCIEASSDESIHNHRAFARVGNPLVQQR
jgi:GTP cyclohydrolase I